MSTDLLRQQPRWKEALVSLREIMTSLVQQVQALYNWRFSLQNSELYSNNVELRAGHKEYQLG